MRRSRRAVLTACGGALTALAGCAHLPVGGGEPEFDTARLAALGETDVPTPPAVFPVSIPGSMVDRHRERARTLVERVPGDPDVPNGAVVERLRHDREAVIERLGTGGADPVDEPLERLDEARHTREEAANVEAAYRAATEEITREEVADRRAGLRSDLLVFEGGWTYRGDDPGSALVLHRELEALRRDVRRGIDPERAFPDDPVADVFRVGEIVSRVEAGRAALADAERLRARYRDGLSDPRPHRAAVSAAVGRLEDLRRVRHHGVGALDPEEPPFDRSIDGTTAGRVYREATVGARRHREGVERARQRGDRADALLEAGLALASFRVLETVVAAIEDGRIEEPTTVDRIETARREAVDALETAWAATPTVVAVELARPASYLLRRGTRALGGREFEHEHEERPDASDARRAFALFYRAARFAEAVPATVADLHRALVDVAE